MTEDFTLNKIAPPCSNSRKRSRELLLFSKTEQELDNGYIIKIRDAVTRFKKDVTDLFQNRHDYDSRLMSVLNELNEGKSVDIDTFILNHEEYSKQTKTDCRFYKNFINDISCLKKRLAEIPVDLAKFDLPKQDLNSPFKRTFQIFFTILPLLQDLLFYYGLKSLYVPTLRGLRPIQSITDDHGKGPQISFKENFDSYKIRTQFDYKFNPNKEIFTGLELYDKIKALLLNDRKEREKVSAFEKFLSENLFDNKEITLIPKQGSDVLSLGIDGEERNIYDIGDGIQQLIILTFPLFAHAGEDLLVFIEEPELFLHPGLQRKFLEVITSRSEFDNFQFFIATHSNHFLDITLDTDQISVFTFKKAAKSTAEKSGQTLFFIENVDNDEIRTLELIGVRNASVFLSNCTIWVEGITDWLYLRKYLEIYQKELDRSKQRFKEDLHYSFLEYGGSNITHWQFFEDNEEATNGVVSAKRICNRIFLVADNHKDGPESKKETRHQKLQNTLKENYYRLNCLEIENLLTEDVLKEVIADYEKKDTSALSFNCNFSRNDYKDEYLGRFIEQALGDKKERKGSYQDSGTINDKPAFCRKALDHIKSRSDMSEEAWELSAKIYNFILRNNP